jgi:uncharacterized protein
VHYYIDGYNLLFRLLSKKGSLQSERAEVISLLNELASQLRLNITVVFDAPLQREMVVRTHFDALEIVYTAEKQSADDYIIEEMNHASSPSQETVVTSDRELASHCKALGAHVQNIESFFSWIKRKKEHKRRSHPSLQKIFQDSPSHIERLLKIFEKRLETPNQDIPNVIQKSDLD